MAAVISKALVFLMDPTFHWFLLACWALVLSFLRSPRAYRVVIWLFAYMFLLLFTPLAQWMSKSLEERYPRLVQPPKKPAVVILTGGTVEYHPQLDQYFWYGGADRFLEPLRLLAGEGTTVFVTGREARRDEDYPLLSESESMGRYARARGYEVVVESRARSTRENAQNIKRELQRRGLQDFYLVTSAFHMPRSMYAFRQQGLEPTPFSVDFSMADGRLSWFKFHGLAGVGLFKRTLHEYVGFLYYALVDLIDPA